MREERDFWSRRRAAVAAEEKAREAARQDTDAVEERARLDRLSDDEVLEELNLPDPDTLEAGDDFSAFMRDVVPDGLRRRALRALWRTNPVLANVDGLVDYGGDFTDSSTVVERLQTAYQVGKGMMAHIEKLSAPAPDPVVHAPAEDEETAPDEVFQTATTDLRPDAVPEPEEESDDVSVSAPAPRRMVFAFEGETG